MDFWPQSLCQKKNIWAIFNHFPFFWNCIFSLPVISFLLWSTFSSLVGCSSLLSWFICPRLSFHPFSLLSFIFLTTHLFTISPNRSLSPNSPPDQPPLNLFTLPPSFACTSYLSLLKSSVALINPSTFSVSQPCFSPASPLSCSQWPTTRGLTRYELQWSAASAGCSCWPSACGRGAGSFWGTVWVTWRSSSLLPHLGFWEALAPGACAP